MNESANIFIFTALECEAKVLINFYTLKKDNSSHPFSIYRNDNVILTVTGIGKVSMAAAVSYALALFSKSKLPILLNIGIAGHKTQAIGTLLMASKVVEAESKKVFYPQLIGKGWPETCEVQTTTMPNIEYSHDCLNDMEASAFYEIAVKFSSCELIHCLKLVSDNEESSIEQINPKKVVEWLSRHEAEIDKVLKQLKQLREIMTPIELPEYNQIIGQWHFTVSGKVRLKALLSRWYVLASSNWLNNKIEYVNGKMVLRQLAVDIDQLEIKL